MRPLLILLWVSPLLMLAIPAHADPNPRDAKTLPTAPAAGSKLGDWSGGPNTGLSIRENALSVVSSGNDPIFYSGVLPPMRGPYFVEFREASNLNGPLEIFWSTETDPNFNGQNKVSIGDAKAFDGKWRNYLVELPASAVAPLHSLRIDPGTSSGEALFATIRLRSMTGKIYKEWKAGN